MLNNPSPVILIAFSISESARICTRIHKCGRIDHGHDTLSKSSLHLQPFGSSLVFVVFAVFARVFGGRLSGPAVESDLLSVDRPVVCLPVLVGACRCLPVHLACSRIHLRTSHPSVLAVERRVILYSVQFALCTLQFAVSSDCQSINSN